MIPDVLWPNEPVIRHARNPTGRDFVVGDIHGAFDVVERALESLRFVSGRDRLFSVGDLIDRGPRSADALEWLQQGRILAVRGNHEHVMIHAIVLEDGVLRKSGHGAEWLQIGGDWFWGYDTAEDGSLVIHDVDHWHRRKDWLAALRTLPLTRTIETAAGTVGIAHTLPDWQESWHELEDELRDIQTLAHTGQRAPRVPINTLWPRPETASSERDAPELPPAMAGIDLALVGHSAFYTPQWLRRNVLCIDTGACAPDGHLTVAEVQSGQPELHIFT